ncbi:MAG: hypothetical protein M3024_04330 [Candidatus Dormibacteraeota bacterium]|nr:hypothetical protein [Candidatus Dormibacteraeota bacterium]
MSADPDPLRLRPTRGGLVWRGLIGLVGAGLMYGGALDASSGSILGLLLLAVGAYALAEPLQTPIGLVLDGDRLRLVGLLRRSCASAAVTRVTVSAQGPFRVPAYRFLAGDGSILLQTDATLWDETAFGDLLAAVGLPLERPGT